MLFSERTFGSSDEALVVCVVFGRDFAERREGANSDVDFTTNNFSFALYFTGDVGNMNGVPGVVGLRVGLTVPPGTEGKQLS